MNATDYKDMLDIHILPFGEAIGGLFWIFQQDNAPIILENSTWELFLQNWVHVMNGMGRKFAGSVSHGELLGYFVSHCVC